jgi:hypothetical protein
MNNCFRIVYYPFVVLDSWCDFWWWCLEVEFRFKNYM